MLFFKGKTDPGLPPRLYLEKIWLPILGSRPPLLDIGVKSYTTQYRYLCGTSQYVSVDIEPQQGPDVVADILDKSFIDLVRLFHPSYQSVLFNGMIGFGANTKKQVMTALFNIKEIMAETGQILIGWNEPNFNRNDLFQILNSLGFTNQTIEGLATYEPPKNSEKLYYTHWIKT